MTDLQTMLVMLSKTEEEFIKRKCGEGWLIEITGRAINIYFNKDESLHFFSNEIRT